MTRRIPYKDTWTPVEGQTEREYRITWMAHPRRHDTLRAVAELVCYVAFCVSVLVLLGMAGPAT